MADNTHRPVKRQRTNAAARGHWAFAEWAICYDLSYLDLYDLPYPDLSASLSANLRVRARQYGFPLHDGFATLNEVGLAHCLLAELALWEVPL